MIKQLLKSITKKLSVLVKDDFLVDKNFNDIEKNPTGKLGIILVALSGMILYLDKAFGYFGINFPIPSRFEELEWDFSTFVWFMSQTLSPLLLIAGGYFKAHKLSYYIPLYFYILQLYYVMFDFKIIDDGHYVLSAFFTSLLVVAIFITVRRLSLNYVKIKIKKEKERLKNELS